MVGHEFSYSHRSCSQSQPAHDSKRCWLSMSMRSTPTLSSSAPAILNLVERLTIEEDCYNSYKPDQPQESCCNVSAKDVCDSESEDIPISNLTAEIDPVLSFSPLSCQSVIISPPGSSLCNSCINEQEVIDTKKQLESVDFHLSTNEQETSDAKKHDVDPHLNVNQSPEELPGLNIEIENSKSPVTETASKPTISVEEHDINIKKSNLDNYESTVESCFNQSQLHALQVPSFEGGKSTSENISSEELSSQNLSGSLFESSNVNDSLSVGQNKPDLILRNPCHDKIETSYNEQEEEEPNEENTGFDINQEQIKKRKYLTGDITNNEISEEELCASNISSYENFSNYGIMNSTISKTADECCMSNGGWPITDKVNPTISETVDECCMPEEIQRESQIKNLCVILKNGVDSSSHENKSNHSYSQHQQNLCKIDASPGPPLINYEITELQSTQNINHQDYNAETKMDYIVSDEDIPCSQLIPVMTPKISSTWKINDQNCIKPAPSNNGNELTFSPLYTQACSQDVAPSCIANISGSPTLPKIIHFSPLRSLDASFACKIPIQMETDELKLSPCCEINTALKSANYPTLTTNLVESFSERKITNDEIIFSEDQENSNSDDGNTNKEDNEHDSDLEHFSSLSQSEHVQNNLDSDQSDEIPILAVFSPLSSCKFNCEIVGKKSGETDIKSRVDVDDDIHLMTSQIVPDCGSKIQKLPNQNEVFTGKEDSDVKSCKKETYEESVQKEFLEMRKCHTYSNEDSENIYQTKKIKVDLPKFSEIVENQLIQEENSSSFYENIHSNDSRVRGDNVNSTFMQQQDILNYGEGCCFEDRTDIQSTQHKLNEQVVPENSLMSVHERNLGESSLYGDQKNMVTKERKPNVLEPYHCSFQWKSVYESVYLENGTRSIPSTADCLECIIPLPSPVKRARPLRVGLSKRQKVRHLHEK